MKLYYHRLETTMQSLPQGDSLIAVSELGGGTEGLGDNTEGGSLDDLLDGGSMDW